MLTGDNYTVWAIKVEANLDAQGVWVAVVPADSTVVVDPKKNKMARAYLLGALVEDILLQVSSKNGRRRRRRCGRASRRGSSVRIASGWLGCPHSAATSIG
jgi:hypothetical protein